MPLPRRLPASLNRRKWDRIGLLLPAHGSVTAMRESSSSRPRSGPGPLRTLVVEDDDIARELICSTLRRAGHQTFELSTPMGATQCVFENQIDIAILDVQLPAVNGRRIATLLRATPTGERLVIALVSSTG